MKAMMSYFYLAIQVDINVILSLLFSDVEKNNIMLVSTCVAKWKVFDIIKKYIWM